ncbi:hypothetical protein OH146_13120 [Salinibacterium sp. SYSU T00001]|uniref:hypothetical protein n=1 Tax=Homoserinimonas sedimenticola TaxID=2986805 RepID=UPI002235ADF9|nr:hypothetical protein [Salinibacterium sedimenticola]MCW4386716.1 hypothetical protein [Salinibacterium sedimenticola]
MPSQSSSRAVGVGRVLIAVYAVLAIAATARSVVQIVERFEEAPLAYLLSAVSAIVYLAATAALLGRGRVWYVVALLAIVFELVGVLTVGVLSLTMPELFAHPSVWSGFGYGYAFIPLVLPILGLVWLAVRRPGADARGTSAEHVMVAPR